MDLFGVWLSAFFTLAIFSFLYRDNPVYKLAEHIFVGVSTGYLVLVALLQALRRDVYEPLFVNPQKEYIVIIPAILGIIMFARFSRRIAWVSRISIALIVGITAGIAIPANVHGFLLRHTYATLEPLRMTGPLGAGSVWNLVSAVLVLVGVITVLMYFFFSVPHRGAMKVVARTGVVFLMLFFGAAFGYTIMGRVSLLIGRMRFLLVDWLHLGT